MIFIICYFINKRIIYCIKVISQYIILNFILNIKLKKTLKIYKISLNDRYLHV